MREVYRFVGREIEKLRASYASLVQEEFYDGQLDAETAEEFNIAVEKALAHPISLMRITTNVGISYRRTWQHIRSNKVGVRVVWFLRRGSLKLTRSSNTCTLSSNDCAILDSTRPFLAQALTDADGVFEAVQAIIPAHLFFSHMPGAVELDQSFRMDSEGGQLISKMLDLMFNEGEHLSRNAADPLAAAFLEVLADNFGELMPGTPGRRQSVVDKRLADIEAYISKHLTDPDLSYEGVAAKCGISPRYLCYVLKANNTSFSTLLWSQRLPKARDWLAAPELQDYPIQEIAFMAGFKSAAHFSRMFKDAYGCSPKEYRMRARQVAGASNDDRVQLPMGMMAGKVESSMMAAA